MPLRDHFRSPVNDKHTWDEVHGLWPSMIVRDLFDILPAGYAAAPNVHLETMFDGGIATEDAPSPTLVVAADSSEPDEYEVRIHNIERERQLVAAIEIVSPSNKDRPDHRQAFVAKVAALLQKGVCVSIVDLVTIRQFNLYADLLELIGQNDPQLAPTPPSIYAVTIRSRKRAKMSSLLEAWSYPLTLGQPLPTLPVWLSADFCVPLPLESSYEETCRLLRIA
jgi:hypothetical protein